MTDIGAELSSELTRIIECPYPASLANLAGLLARTDAHTIRACIHNRPPCAVARLATLVCEALPLWAYTLRVLHSLCHSPEFRDKLLLQNHGLLNALLAKANSSQRDFDDYVELCVLILSRPLPESVSLPTSAQSFFLRVFEKATQKPDLSTLKPVYCMLNGACRQLLGLLPTETRQQFDRELCHILSSNGTGQNSMLLLWCFGIVLLAEHPENVGALQNLRSSFDQPVSTPHLEQQWKTASGRKLFGSTSGLYKTINLTYLSVIWAAKGDVGVTDAEAIEGIRIAVRTLWFVDRDIREGWPKSSALAKNIFPKLPSKILRSGICPALQLEALCFYAMIAGEKYLLPEVVAQYEDCLTQIPSFANADSLGETLSVSLPIFAPHLQENSVRTLLYGILNACISAPTSHQLSNFITLIDGLTTALRSCALLRSKMLLAISSNNLQEKLWSFIHDRSVKESSTCRTNAASLHREVVSATIASLLTLVLTMGPTELSVPHVLVAALIKKQRELPYVSSQCSHILATAPPSISLFQQECTQFTGQHLQDWRDRLKSELESQNFYQRDSVVRSVAQICQDLETRCNTVEEPLRREQERSKELEQQISQLKEQVSSLKSQADDDRYHLEGLEDEKLIMAEEKNRVATKLDELKVEFAEADRAVQETLRTVQEEFHAKELDFRSATFKHEENIRAGANEIEALNGSVSQLRRTLEENKAKQDALHEQHQDLQSRFDESESQLDSERETVFRQSEEIKRLKNQNTDIDNQLLSTETELEVITGRLSDLQVSHQELVQSSEEVLRELEVKYTDDMDAAAAKAEDQSAKLNNELQIALHKGREAKEAYDEVRREFQLLQNSVPPLEAKLQELTEFCTEQEEELEELRTLRRNVLKSFGLATPNPLAIRSAARPQTETNDPQTPRAPREHRRRKSAIQTQDVMPKATGSTQGPPNTTMENVADASSDSHGSQNGPTPKRPKPRPSFKVPAMHTPYTQKPILNSRSLSKKLSPSKRSALRQLSPNRRHTTVGFAASENEEEYQYDETTSARKRRGSLQQPDFDMDDFLAGTPLMTPGRFETGTGRVPDEDDVTTTEL
ncbi:hypothetical protein P153DRAFT_383117 [Dothidotthia symphoricarpi CBS 119687]|uniref:Uncharacterized protein n=1 Tax=Dothidotthia symphoricarpi CBS 119687 TaxID=1392245 RepID=A0A6A6AMW4_9PLEO|nr:uncharacterized protein P153DRAFT_383117 [Dothidotthia symphoricarpi CBS 119687]KAF2132227.1 hypothetical protein P153DRAFT_383117 [Dothidotthia symphoricarpi CBS 119687]